MTEPHGSFPSGIPDAAFSALPCGRAASGLHQRMRARWKRDLVASVALCAERLPDDLGGVLGRAHALDPARRWSPVVYYRSVELQKAMLDGHWTPVVDALQHLSVLSDAQAYDARRRVETLLVEDWEFGFVDEMRRYLPRDAEGRATLVGPVFGADAAPHDVGVREALALFREADPALAAEDEELVCRVKYYQGKVLRGEAAMKTFGAVYVRTPPPDDHAVSYWLEHLVHEAAHHYALLLHGCDPLVLNPRSERYPPPIRRDPRPVVGIFHAVFVLARMIRVFARLVQLGAGPAYEARLALFREQYARGVAVLDAHARYTALGARVAGSFDGCCEGERGEDVLVPPA